MERVFHTLTNNGDAPRDPDVPGGGPPDDNNLDFDDPLPDPIPKMMTKPTVMRSSLRTLWSSSLRLSRASLMQVVVLPLTLLLTPRSGSLTSLTGRIPANSGSSQDHPRAFSMDCTKVMFVQLYLKGMALE